MNARAAIPVVLLGLLTIFLIGLALASTKIALAAALGITALAIIFFSPFYGLLIYLGMLYIRPQDFIPALAQLRVMLLLAVAIIGNLLVQRTFRREKISFFATRQHIFMFILLLLVPISNIANGRLADAWDGLNEFVTVFLLFLIIVNVAEGFERFRKVCWALVFFTTLIAVNGVIMHVRGFGLAGTMPVEGTRVLWIGIFGDPNDYALAINAFFPFILFGMFDKDIGRAKKLLILAAGCIMLFTLYLTNSRGGFVGFIAIMGLFSIKKWGFFKGAIAGAVLLVAMQVLTPGRMGEISPYEASAAGRVGAWIHGLVLLKQHPVIGIGYQKFGEYYVVWGRSVAAHSSYIQAMVELGLVGYFFWIGILYSCFWDVRGVSAGPDTPYKKYAAILQLSLVGYMVSSAFLSQAYMPVLYLLVALCVLASHNPAVGSRYPGFLSFNEVIRVGLLMGGTIIAHKVLAMAY